MAEKAVEENLSCPLCFEIFDEPTILTSCGHTFCRKCLKNYDKTQQQHRHVDHMVCPICREVTKFKSTNRVDDFCPNVSVRGLVDDVKALFEKSLKCTACRQQGEAVSFCKTCDCYLCKECLASHRNMYNLFEGHEIVSLDDARKEKKANHTKSDEHCSGRPAETPNTSSSTHNDPNATTSSNSEERTIRVLVLNDGTRIRTMPDGSKIKVMPDGRKFKMKRLTSTTTVTRTEDTRSHSSRRDSGSSAPHNPSSNASRPHEHLHQPSTSYRVSELEERTLQNNRDEQSRRRPAETRNTSSSTHNDLYATTRSRS